MLHKIEEMIRGSETSFTKLEQRVATYLIGRPEALALETSAEIAQKLDVSPMTVSRFFKNLGLSGQPSCAARPGGNLPVRSRPASGTAIRIL